jgi:uncharacterized damage-inducible protein DinB
MSEPVLTAQELIIWNEKTAAGWRKLLTNHPELLTKPCDIANTRSIAELLQHIVAAQLRYAERLANLPISDYATIPFDSVESIYATHDRSIAILQKVLASQDYDWDEPIDFATRTMGTLHSNRRTILFHALLHGIRHYAQLASLVRQCGIKADWPMDYLFMNAELVPY